MEETKAILFASGLLSLILSGYFFGLSDGLKKEKRPSTEFEVKLAVGMFVLSGILIGFGF